jgi:probable HAF family extracellular repeat protein
MFAQAINASGQVTGYSAKGTYTWHAFRTPTMTEIPTFGGQYSMGFAINNAGLVVGAARSNSTERAFLWQGGALVDFTKKQGSRAQGVNNLAKPQIVGYMPLSANGSGHQAFVWQDGKLKALPPPGGSQSAAFAVNDAGQIAGSSSTSDDATSRAVLWPSSTASSPIDLGVGSGSTAVAINASGQVVGTYTGPGGVERSFFSAGAGSGGAWQDLPGQSGADRTEATAINASGTVVGWSPNGNGGLDYAVRWQKDGSGVWVVTNLNALIAPGLGLKLYSAAGINDAGQIVCQGYYLDPITGQPDGLDRAFVLTPTAQ